MAAPTLSTSDPTDNAVGIFRNKSISLEFDTALLASTVNSSTVILRSSLLNEIVDANITLSGSTITIAPWNLLIASSTYTVTIIGADLGLATGAIQSSDSSDLALTATITFQTGVQISTATLGKTEEELAIQGDVFLPTEVTITDTGFSIVNTSPKNHEFSIPTDKNQLVFTFSTTIDTGTVVDGTSFILSQYAFLDEEGLLAVTGADGVLTFQQDNTGLNFTDITGSIEVVGTQILWTKETSRNWMNNSCVEVFLGSTIGGTSGNTLGYDQKVTFYTDPHPDIVGIRALKNELGTLMPNTYQNDYLGLRLWFRSIETWEDLNRNMNLSVAFNKNRSFKEYIRCKSALDIIEDIRGEKDLGAGTSKTLGDFKVSFFPAGADTKSRKEISLENMCDKAWRALVGYINRPTITVKGRGGVVQRGSRVWRMPILYNSMRNVYVSDPVPAANTSNERNRKLPGFGDAE